MAAADHDSFCTPCWWLNKRYQLSAHFKSNQGWLDEPKKCSWSYKKRRRSERTSWVQQKKYLNSRTLYLLSYRSRKVLLSNNAFCGALLTILRDSLPAGIEPTTLRWTVQDTRDLPCQMPSSQFLNDIFKQFCLKIALAGFLVKTHRNHHKYNN